MRKVSLFVLLVLALLAPVVSRAGVRIAHERGRVACMSSARWALVCLRRPA